MLVLLAYRPALSAILGLSLYFLGRALYRLSPFHPLAHIPGPYLPRLSSLWLIYHAWIGDECTVVHKLHEKYGTIVRTGPNSVDIADGEALHEIYSKNGGMRKTAFYTNFQIDGHESIFSEIVPEQRGPRAKAVLPMFATSNLRAGQEVLDKIVQSFVLQVKNSAAWSKKTGQAIDLLDLTRGLAIDAVTGYLFGRPYGGLELVDSEDKGPVSGMSANAFVDSFTAVGRFWYAPQRLFVWLEWFAFRFGEANKKDVAISHNLVDRYVAEVVDDAKASLTQASKVSNGIESTSYPARLLSAGLSISETRAQSKDLMFAGTDSTGMNLATIMFHLIKQPKILLQLENELEAHNQVTDFMEIQSLPYLRGTVREGLRLSMANPSRLPRVVSSSGWVFKGVRFAAGTEVSCTPFELHLNPQIFTSPLEFDPTRWFDDQDNSKEMERDAIPFGLGPRQCIARNLASAELYLAVKHLVKSKVLRNAQTCSDKIEILEWFNSHVKGGKIDVKWTR